MYTIVQLNAMTMASSSRKREAQGLCNRYLQVVIMSHDHYLLQVAASALVAMNCMHMGGVALARAKIASGTAHRPSPEIRPAAAGT